MAFGSGGKHRAKRQVAISTNSNNSNSIGVKTAGHPTMTAASFVTSLPLRTLHHGAIPSAVSTTRRYSKFPVVATASSTPSPATPDATATSLSPIPGYTPTPAPTTAPISVSLSTPPPRPHHDAPLPSEAVPYFAYFANINPRKIGPLATNPLRRFRILRSSPATLTGYRINFSAIGAPPEPAFANLAEDRDTTVYGVLHWMDPLLFKRLALSEGVPPEETPSPLRDLAQATILPRVVPVSVLTQDGNIVTASTFVFPSLAPRWAKPSRRYVNLAIDGARHWGLDRRYIDSFLSKIEYDRGPLGGFGLFVEPRPHPLDRPNPTEEFGDLRSEFYSPYASIRAKSAIDSFEKSLSSESPDSIGALTLIQATVPDVGKLKRLLYFLPGIDGNGKSILSQVHGIEEEGVYDLKAFAYPSDNRKDLRSFVDNIIDMIAQDSDGRPVSIISESMGGSIALLIGIENTRRASMGNTKALDIDLLLMMNPATSFMMSDFRPLWETLLKLQLPDQAYRALLPPILLPFLLDLGAATEGLTPETFPRMRRMLFSLGRVADILPHNSVVDRIGLLTEVDPTAEELRSLESAHGPTDIAVVGSLNDKLLPSFAEVFRLRKAIPSILTMTLPYGGHAPMLDKRFSLAGLLRPFAHGAVAKRVEPSGEARAPGSEAVRKRREAMKKRVAGRSEAHKNNDKTRAEIRRLADFVAPSMREAGTVFVGEENLPVYDGKRPVLFVCNHTLLGWLDAALPMIRLMQKRGVLLRGMAHPMLFRTGMMAFPGTGMERATVEEIEEYGVKQVSPQALTENLALGHWSLLFPGGAREAIKEPGDKKYRLLWPEEAEFVRACALFGAVVVPISTIGTEDRVRLLTNSSLTKKILEVLGPLLFGAEGKDMEKLAVDDARQWQGEDAVSVVTPPLMVPNGQDRLYFRFGKAVVVDELCLTDERKEREVYNEIRRRVEEGVDILERRREKDMFRSVGRRRSFARDFGEDVEAPASPAWGWAKGGNEYLDEEWQVPL